MNYLTKDEQLQAAASEYLRLFGPADRMTITAWAYRNKRIQPDEMDIIEMMARQMSQAMCTEYHIDPQQRKVRSKYAVRRRVKDEWGVEKQMYFWYDHETIDEESMRVHLSQRRRHIVGLCQQGKNDSESFNENRDPQIPMVFDVDFEKDMKEAQESTSHPDFEVLDGGVDEEEL